MDKNLEKKLEKEANKLLTRYGQDKEYPFLTERQLRRRRSMEVYFPDFNDIDKYMGIFNRADPYGRKIENSPRGKRKRYFKEKT